MFGRAGIAYVYRIHQCYCLNVVTGAPGDGQAVLIRAVEPIEGIDRMSRARARATGARTPPTGVAVTNGPGKLCQAFDIDARFDGVDLLAGTEGGSGLFLEPRILEPKISTSARIGISRATRARLRFFVRGNPWVSR